MFEKLIQSVHAEVDADRRKRRLPPWDWKDAGREAQSTAEVVKRMENEEVKERDSSDTKSIAALVAQRGIRTSADFAEFMGGLMVDLVEGRIDPKVANAACVAGKNLIEIARMQLEYGERSEEGGSKAINFRPQRQLAKGTAGGGKGPERDTLKR